MRKFRCHWCIIWTKRLKSNMLWWIWEFIYFSGQFYVTRENWGALFITILLFSYLSQADSAKFCSIWVYSPLWEPLQEMLKRSRSRPHFAWFAPQIWLIFPNICFSSMKYSTIIIPSQIFTPGRYSLCCRLHGLGEDQGVSLVACPGNISYETVPTKIKQSLDKPLT